VKRRTLLVGSASLAALFAAGCQSSTGGDTNSGGTGDAGGPALSDATAVDINIQPRDALAQGGTFRLSVGAIQDQWNSSQSAGNTGDTVTMLSPCSPAIYYTNEKGTPTWNPDYLKAEPTATVTDGKLVVTFTISDKAVWGDKTPITVADYQATWKALNGSNKKFQAASTEGFDQLESVTQGATDHDVIYTFKKTYPDWTAIMGVARAESVADPDTFNTGWKQGPKPEWLSGPFKFDSITADLVTLVPNENWWGEPALLEKITFKKIENNSAVPNAFANNEIDSFDIGSDANAYQVALKTPNAQVRKAAGPNFRQFTFNSTAGNLKDEAVRQSVVAGLDRTQVASSDLAGIDWPATPLNNMIFMQNQTGYEDLAEKTGLKYDQDAAKKLLDDAGWAAGSDGMRAKGGQKLTIEFSQLTGVTASENEGLQLQNQMKSVGVDVKLVPTDSTKFSDILVAGQFQIMAFTWLGTPYPFGAFAQIYATGAENNFAKSKIPEVDDNLNTLQTEVDPQKRIDLGNQVAEAL